MTRIAGQLKSSVNAGQLSSSLFGKVGLKQYYSGAKVMKGVEPIPQAGFKLLPGSARVGAGVAGAVCKTVLRVSPVLSYTIVITPGLITVWRNDRAKVATVSAPALSAARIPDLKFYGEANTLGIFHPTIAMGLKLFRNKLDDSDWTLSAWPFEDIPLVDLGGAGYAKTTDKWQFFVRFTDAAPSLVMSVSIDGNESDSVTLTADGVVTPPRDLPNTHWANFATNLEAKARLLPGMTNDLVISFNAGGSSGGYKVFDVRFPGALDGQEYDFDAQVLNTSEASVLTSHVKIGKTKGEPLISSSQGGFAGASNYQDRQIYFAPAGKTAAIAMSRTGEYFDLNIEASDDAAARLESLRTDTAETILHVFDATYLVAFTDRAEYFASNRTVKRNEPLNWVRASTIGTRSSCAPVSLEGYVYFVSSDGGRLYRANYDAVSETFAPVPVNDLNGAAPSDLVTNIKSMAVQHKRGSMVADRLWLLRDDGRLVCAIANVSEDIRLAASEWPVAGGGFIHAIAVDGQDQLWLTVERNGAVSEEIFEEEDENIFQMTFTVGIDLTGRAEGLSALNGQTVWALIENDVYGPYTVGGGRIIIEEAAGKTAKIGLWTAPVFESMPYIRVLQNDDVVRRPGKVGSVRLFVENTASLAIGANGRPVKDVALQRSSDNLAGQKINFTGHVPVAGLIGACMDPTLTISQVRPGRLHVRDYIPGVRL